ncbi:MAG: transposase [Betaproteobacteria bacterium]|nr:transposase [Betaproteobacteria bacterium]
MQLIHEAGHRMLFLPPYSPHLNPIEKLWANTNMAKQITIFHRTNYLRVQLITGSTIISATVAS